jgi:aspartyl-tRNA(Asn)/glutamyl-tRNA(Gln) amidotransferase subunit A
MTVADLRTIADVAPLIRSGALSPADLVRECLAQIEARPHVNAYITLLRDPALEQAHRAEHEIGAGAYKGPLHGIPIAVKDLINVAGTRTTSGSALPSAEASVDAPSIQRLRDAGAIILGKTNLHEFAFGTTSEDSAFGPVRNPHDQARSAGGSSGGSAAALAAGMTFGALGTDTGGSIRIPSAACGTVGLKASLGELSCDGVVPLSTTLDHLGPMARSVADVALLYRVLKPTASEPPAAPERLVFGVPRPYFCDLLDDGVRESFDRVCASLREAGHDVEDVEIEHAAWTPHVYLHIVLPEASCYHAPFIERHASSYSPDVRLRLEMGRYVLAEDYVRAMRLRALMTQRVDRVLQQRDALLLPSLAIPAPRLGTSSVEIGGRTEPIRGLMLRLTQLFNITGHPAIAIPSGYGDDGLPRSVQLVGRRGGTEELLAIASAVERHISGGPGSVGGGTG